MQLLHFIHVHNNFPSLSQHRTRCIFCNSNIALAWENSRYLLIPPLVSPRNDVWDSTEIPYLVWWRVATQTWALSFWLVVPLVKFASTNQKHYPNLGSDASSEWNFCARFSDVISGGNRSWRRKMSSVFSGWYHTIRNYSALISHQERLPFILDSK